jgi:putative ABC transport system permease protein
LYAPATIGRCHRNGGHGILRRMSPAHLSILQGLQATTINPLRTGLSTLGVVIGVASVIATLSLTDGLEQYARAELSARTDVQSVTVTSRTTELRDGFRFPLSGYVVLGLNDAAELERRLDADAEVTMVASTSTVVGSSLGTPRGARATGALANFLEFGRRSMHAGRWFTDGETARNAPVVVLSHKLAADLSPNGDPVLMLGRVVRVDRRPVTTVGIMPSYTGEQDYEVYLPMRAALTLFGATRRMLPSLIVRSATFEGVNDVKDAIEEWLATRYRNWQRRVEVSTQLARIEDVRMAMLVFRLVMGSLAGIALVVGGVGIMNVLLASVAERTREIGVRKALGARQRDILLQFLAESVAIAGAGAVAGTALGLSLAFALSALVRNVVPEAPLHAAITAGTLGSAVSSAVIVGLVFGTFPALRASRLSPIDAIRHD